MDKPIIQGNKESARKGCRRHHHPFSWPDNSEDKTWPRRMIPSDGTLFSLHIGIARARALLLLQLQLATPHR